MKKAKTVLLLVAVVLVCSTLLTFTLTSKKVVSFKKTEMIPNPENILGIDGDVVFYSNIMKNGITFEYNEDGSYHIYGISTDPFFVQLCVPFYLEAGKTYMLSSGMEHDGLRSYYSYLASNGLRYVGDLDPDPFSEVNIYGAFTCDDPSVNYVVGFGVVCAGAVIDEMFYPCLVEGDQPGDFYIEKTP